MQDMIKRHLTNQVRRLLKSYPAVALLGARQTGKTTLAKTLSTAYYDLELEQERLRLDLQWEAVVKAKGPVILDEAQHFPEIFPRIRSAIDLERKKNGRFLILGSVSPGLMRQVSEALTGRVALTELYPFSIQELRPRDVDDVWLAGGFPDGGVLEEGKFPGWQNNYLELLAMRDLPAWGMPAKPATTRRFFRMIASSHGSTWNASMIGKSMGVSYHTVNTYLDYLEQAFLIRRLAPYAANIRKRLVKSPKIYWRDSGLLHALLSVSRKEDLLAQPWVGASWEGWVIEQILTALNNRGVDSEAFFLRTSDGNELDLILVIRGAIWAVEVKLASMIDRRDVDRLEKAADMIGAHQRLMVSRTRQTLKGPNLIVADVRGALEELPS